MGTRLLYSEEQILQRVDEMAKTIQQELASNDLAVVGLLEDSFVFMADLIRKIRTEMVCYFMKADVDEGEKRVSRIKKISYSPELDIHQKDVLLVGGVLDTGITLDYIIKHLLQGQPSQVKTCYLIDKTNARKISIAPDYAGFVVQPEKHEYIVGYGLGYENRYRNLPFLGVASR